VSWKKYVVKCATTRLHSSPTVFMPILDRGIFLFPVIVTHMMYFCCHSLPLFSTFFHLWLTEPVEEVIAEDYDDRHEPSHPSDMADEIEGSAYADDHQSDDIVKFDDLDESDELVHNAPMCPNRSNDYHSCTDYCRKRYGYKRFKADPTAARGRDHLLKHYPLPPGWLEVGDAER